VRIYSQDVTSRSISKLKLQAHPLKKPPTIRLHRIRLLTA
jgi:hypothetical protein